MIDIIPVLRAILDLMYEMWYFQFSASSIKTPTIFDKNLETLWTFSHRIRPPPFFNVVAASQTVKSHLNTVQGKGVFQGFLARIVGI